MAVFKDGKGREWKVELDGFILEDVRSEVGVDLGDWSAAGWHRLATHSPTVGMVLASVCADQYPESRREFAKTIVGAAIESGRKAMLTAASVFFPPSEWSEIQSNLEKRKKNQQVIITGKEFNEIWETVAPIFTAIESMPPEMKAGAEAELAKQIKAAGGTITDLEKLKALASAGGQEGTPSTSGKNSPGSAESSEGESPSGNSGSEPTPDADNDAA
jgi:hypothetical protein